MRRFLGIVLAAMLISPLAACGGDSPPPATASTSPPPTSTPSPTPSPSATPAPTKIVDVTNPDVRAQDIAIAFAALDTTATAVDSLIAHKIVTPGSPTALTIAGGLNGTRTWLNRASALQKIGDILGANAAFEQAQAAIAGVKRAIGSTK